MHGGVRPYAAQAIMKIDAARAEKRPFRTETGIALSMPMKVTFVCLLVTFCSLREANAAGTLEIKPARGFLLLEGIQQSAGLRYQYNDHESSSTNSGYSSHKLDEIYHVDTGFSILDPHLLRISLSGDLWFQQIKNSSELAGSSSGSGLRYQYSLTASAMDRSWHPVLLHNSLSHDTVVAPFSPTFETETGRIGIESAFVRDPYRLKFRAERNTLNINGGGVNSSMKAYTFQASGTHKYRDIMTNSLDFTVGAQASTSRNTRDTAESHGVNYANMLGWGPKKKYALTSQFQLGYTTSRDLPQQNIIWSEDFRSQLGKALEGELTYRYNETSTTVSPGREQLYSVNSAGASLTHRLFQSLNTRLHGNISQANLLGGNEIRFSEGIDWSYRKKLPARSQFRLDASVKHEVTDRNLNATEFIVGSKRFTVTGPFGNIDLETNAPLVAGSVAVKGFTVAPPNPQFPPDKVYVEGSDYTVDYNLGLITWGPIVPAVADIEISYTVRFDPSVEFSADSLSLSGTLFLLNNRYMVNGYLFGQDYSLISGQANNGLFDTRVKRVQFQAFFERQSCSLIYSDYASGSSQYQYFEGWWQYHMVYPIQFQLLVRDRYTMYDATSSAAGYAINALSASASYSRDLFSRARLLLSLNFLDNRGGRQGTSDDISARASIRMRFNKLTVELLGSSSLRIGGGSTIRDDYARLEMRRFF